MTRLFYSFRKAVLPIEDEINSESKSSSNEVKEMVEGSPKPEEMIARMEQIQQQLFDSAKINIDKAQECYKRIYDIKERQSKLHFTQRLILLRLACFILFKRFKLNSWSCYATLKKMVEKVASCNRDGLAHHTK